PTLTGNKLDGVRVTGGASGNKIGEPVFMSLPALRNIISGNGEFGIWIMFDSKGNFVQNSYIGTNTAGTGAVPNTFDGVEIDSDGNLVGGTGDRTGNLVSGNKIWGVRLLHAKGNTVQGNLIGTDAG